MTNTIYIRNVPADVLARIDAEATRERRSRNSTLLLALERLWPVTAEEIGRMIANAPGGRLRPVLPVRSSLDFTKPGEFGMIEHGAVASPPVLTRKPRPAKPARPEPSGTGRRDTPNLKPAEPAKVPHVHLGPAPLKPGSRLKPSKGKA